MNVNLLQNIVSQAGSCLECQHKITIDNMLEKGMGYAHNLKLQSTFCSWQSSHCTSEKVKFKKSKGRQFHEINLRAGIAFRERERAPRIGKFL